MKEYIERANVHSIIERTSTFAFTRGGMHEQVDSLSAADVAPVEMMPRWVRPETALPEADETVLVIASGRPVHETILDHAVLLAKWYQDDGWILDEFPSYGSPKIHFWAPIPEPPEEARP